MKIVVNVKTNVKQEKIERVGKDEFAISVCMPPTEGRANTRVIKLLSEYFKIPKSSILLARGKKSKKKIFQL